MTICDGRSEDRARPSGCALARVVENPHLAPSSLGSVNDDYSCKVLRRKEMRFLQVAFAAHMAFLPIGRRRLRSTRWVRVIISATDRP